ncbi:MAG: hypothetical protein EAZ59_11155 [Oscillatoriales cyanobacterium]|nr:MAG: hypothetical protein EAZ59_11155 [Oscillatoriales cyanobacterium]
MSRSLWTKNPEFVENISVSLYKNSDRSKGDRLFSNFSTSFPQGIINKKVDPVILSHFFPQFTPCDRPKN